MSAFCTRYGHYEQLVMPYSLSTASATFQYFVHKFFKDNLDLFIIIYLDDILIFLENQILHDQHV